VIWIKWFLMTIILDYRELSDNYRINLIILFKIKTWKPCWPSRIGRCFQNISSHIQLLGKAIFINFNFDLCLNSFIVLVSMKILILILFCLPLPFPFPFPFPFLDLDLLTVQSWRFWNIVDWLIDWLIDEFQWIQSD
jgi:hypothetical protein